MTEHKQPDKLIVDDRSNGLLIGCEKVDKRQQIIEIAADLIHQYGYNNVGIQKIIELAHIPKGSFYHYFTSKEVLGLAVIDYYIEQSQNIFGRFEKSVSGLKEFFQCYFTRFEEFACKRGCPIGNLALELSDVNENFRLRLKKWTSFMEEEILKILENSSLNPGINKQYLASFIVSAFEGALLKAKLEKCKKPLKEFNYFIFDILLKEKEDV